MIIYKDKIIYDGLILKQKYDIDVYFTVFYNEKTGTFKVKNNKTPFVVDLDMLDFEDFEFPVINETPERFVLSNRLIQNIITKLKRENKDESSIS